MRRGGAFNALGWGRAVSVRGRLEGGVNRKEEWDFEEKWVGWGDNYLRGGVTSEWRQWGRRQWVGSNQRFCCCKQEEAKKITLGVTGPARTRMAAVLRRN